MDACDFQMKNEKIEILNLMERRKLEFYNKSINHNYKLNSIVETDGFDLQIHRDFASFQYF